MPYHCEQTCELHFYNYDNLYLKCITTYVDHASNAHAIKNGIVHLQFGIYD